MTAHDQRYYELYEHIADLRGRSKAKLFLSAAIERYGLRHLAYAGINIPNPNRDPYYLAVTYPKPWMDRYVAKGYIHIDPVVHTAFTAVAPFEWSQLYPLTRVERAFFGESVELGLGRHGFTVPIRGAGDQVALLSINYEGSDREWRKLKNMLMRDFVILATLFHESPIRDDDLCLLVARDELSTREIECLKWAAEGKSAWETSVILGVSERCVRFHLDQARRKLDCLTKVQTVAKAVAVGLVALS